MATKYIEEFASTTEFLARAADRSNKLGIGSVAETLYINKGGSAKAIPSIVGSGVKIAGGAVALDGSNPTTVATGLTTILAAVATLKGSSAPGDNTSVVTVDFTGSNGNLDIYAWKNTGGSDPTLVASTGTETVEWVAIGT